jgi:DNA-binding transcriptional ArsR family regulator
MVTLTEERLDAAFAALADPTRRAIVGALARGDATVNELAAPFEISLPGVSKHLKVLERSGLISRRRDAQFRPCHLEVDVLDAALDWIGMHRRIWDERFDKLDALLADIKRSPRKSSGTTTGTRTTTGTKGNSEPKEGRHARGHDDG